MLRRRLCAPLLSLVAGVAALPAFAQSDAPRLDRLNAPDYAVRQAATAELLRDETIGLDQLRAMFHAATTPEQRHRLLDVIRHHTLRRDRIEMFGQEAGDPSIGFSHDIRQRRARPAETGAGEARAVVLVVATLPGFPGYAYLQPGDIITAVDGEDLPANLDNEGFKTRLRRHQAGDRLGLSVLRDGRSVEIELELATVDALERMYTQSPTLQEPFRSRWEEARDELLAAAPPTPTLAVPAAE